MSDVDRTVWNKTDHESKVEKFYGTGAENFGSYHQQYLNFGLWEEGIEDFVEAAENLVQRMGTLLGLDSESHLLDVACGMGTQDIYLMRNFAPRRIDALDVTWKHIEHGRQKARDAKLDERLQFHHGTATQLPFQDQSFSHVLSIEGPVHFNTREQFMREAHRVLKPGGTFALSDYSLRRKPRNPYEKLVINAAMWLWKVPTENADSIESYTEKMKRSGFEQVEIQEIGELVIPGYFHEQQRPETIRELVKVRGFVAGRLGGIIDHVIYKAHTIGLLGYILVRAKKPSEAHGV